MKTQIGTGTIEVLEVKHTRTNKEFGDDEPSYWHTGTATVEWMADGHGSTVEVSVGCWADTDDDNAEWCAANEGANAIERCFGGTGKGDSRGSFVRAAFADACDALGKSICRMLREAGGVAETV